MYARTFNDHLLNFDFMLSRIVSHGLGLKPSKCNFLKTDVQF